MFSTLANSFRLAQSEKYSLGQLDAEMLVAHVLGISREEVLTHPERHIPHPESKKLGKLFQRRSQGEPLAYILGQKEFFGRDFIVTKDTLIPRPETEILIESVFKKLKSSDPTKKTGFLDIGTGSGCIIVTLTKEFQHNQNTSFFACDVSQSALDIAKKNAQRHKVKTRIQFTNSDLLESYLKNSPFQNIDELFIIANLPYVETAYLEKTPTKLTQGLAYEPRIALDGGNDGLDFYRKLLIQTKKLQSLYPNLTLTHFYEIDATQKNTLTREILKTFPSSSPQGIQDLAQNYRVVQFSF